MKYSLFILACCLLSFKPLLVGQHSLHASWDNMLQTFVSPDGRVDYKTWKGQEMKLDEYLRDLAEAVPSPEDRSDEAKAFWINAYNAFTVKLILKHYPVKSIMDIHGGKAWDVSWIQLGDKSYSLNEIEHQILRPSFGDARIHFAVNCAARSCPPLWNRAYLPKMLNRQLDERTKLFVNAKAFNQITSSSASLSMIFDWYKEDFGELVRFINQYSLVKLNSGAKLSFQEYNWALND